MVKLEDNFKIDFRFFCSIAAFSERVLSRWNILPSGALQAHKEIIEKADFTNLTWKLEGVHITNQMQKVLFALWQEQSKDILDLKLASWPIAKQLYLIMIPCANKSAVKRINYKGINYKGIPGIAIRNCDWY